MANIIRFGGGGVVGGGGQLKWVASSKEPNNPKLGMIWVKEDGLIIDKVVQTQSLPETKEPNTIYMLISAGDSTIDAITFVKNNTYELAFKVLSLDYYNSEGVKLNPATSIYDGEKWVPYNEYTYYYLDGEQYSEITGGWTLAHTAGDAYYSNEWYDEDDDEWYGTTYGSYRNYYVDSNRLHMYVYYASSYKYNYAAMSVSNVKPIDVTNLRKIRVRCGTNLRSQSYNPGRYGISILPTRVNSSYNNVSPGIFNFGNGTFDIDVRDLVGEYYVVAWIYAYYSYRSMDLYLYEVQGIY